MNSYLLRISTVCNRLVIIVVKKNVTESNVGNILNNMPFSWELSAPSILLPVICILLKINRSNHFSYPTELSTCVNLLKPTESKKTWKKIKNKCNAGHSSKYIEVIFYKREQVSYLITYYFMSFIIHPGKNLSVKIANRKRCSGRMNAMISKVQY